MGKTEVFDARRNAEVEQGKKALPREKLCQRGFWLRARCTCVHPSDFPSTTRKSCYRNRRDILHRIRRTPKKKKPAPFLLLRKARQTAVIFRGITEMEYGMHLI
jgi:hypothetical protein